MTTLMQDIFGPGSNVRGRVYRDYRKLRSVVEACKNLNLRIVLTSGTFDLFHVGHSRYLEQAKKHGEVLVVGVDSDDKTRHKKGPHRPVVHEDERMEILCHTRHVDLVFLKQAHDHKWQLIKTVLPHVLIVTEESYGDKELSRLRKFCGKVVVLKPQAITSTTARIRRVLVSPADQVKKKLEAAFADISSLLDELTGGVK